MSTSRDTAERPSVPHAIYFGGNSIHAVPKHAQAISEGGRCGMPQVLAHPQYQSNPIAAITSHLSATLPPPPEAAKPKPDPAMRKQQKALRKWKQKVEGPNAMAEDSE